MKIIINDDYTVNVILDSNTSKLTYRTADTKEITTTEVENTQAEVVTEEFQGETETVTENVEGTEGVVDTPASEESLEGIEVMPEEGAINGEIGMPEYMPPQPKKSLLSSVPFLIVLTVAVLAVGSTFGILLAKRKIKKGLDIDENY